MSSAGLLRDYYRPYWNVCADSMKFYNCCDDCIRVADHLESKPHLRVLLEDEVDLETLMSSMHGEEGPSIPLEEQYDSSSQYSSLTDIQCTCYNDKLSQSPSRNSYASIEPLLMDQRTSPEWSRENSPDQHRYCHVEEHNHAYSQDRGVPKSFSLPLSEAVPDPFPELISPVLNTSQSLLQSQSSPSSPVLSRAQQQQQPLSRKSSEKSDKKSTLTRRHSEYTQSYSQSWPKSSRSKDKKMMLEFYTDDKTCKAVELEDSTKALDVCYQLILLNRVKEEKNWCLVEFLPRFNLERMVEDHESVLHVFKTWGHNDDNRFYFKRDFRKYEFLTRPQKFFPMHMLDISYHQLENYELSGKAERLKNILLQNLFSADRLPDIQGYLHMKDGKKSWKRYFFVLRKSGLYYSTKNLSKDPRHLTLFCSLSDVDIYYAQQPKKTLGAPTNFCLVMKPPKAVSDIKDLKCICVDDEASRTSWCTALRIIKHGSMLQENHRAAMRNEDKLRTMESRVAGHGTYIKSRVAMDFTGSDSRVVTDPNEALSVAIEEGSHWIRRPANMSRSSSPTGSSLGSSPRAAYQPHPMTLHMVQPWYHGNIPREDAVSLIVSEGCIDGLFLVRESQSVAGAYVLSLAHNHCVKHCQIHQFESEGQIFVSLDGGHTRFSDLVQLIDFYMLNQGRLPTRLTHFIPVSRMP